MRESHSDYFQWLAPKLTRQAVYNECDIYDPFLAAGKPQIQIEYGSSIKSCPALKPGQNLAVYRGETLDSKKITLNCPGPSA